MPVRAVAPRKATPTRARAPQRPEQLFDTHPETSLDLELVRSAARDRYARPFLLIDARIVREKTRRFVAAMPRVRPHYAVKANPDPRVLRVLIEEGARFEIASTAELDLLCGLGVPAAQVFYSNPMKSREWIDYAAAKGVEWFVVDCRRGAAQGPRRPARRRSSTCASTRPTSARLAARRQVRGARGRDPGDHRDRRRPSARTSPGSRSTSAPSAATRRTGASASRSARAVFDQMIAAGLKPEPPQHRAAASRCGT